MIKTLVFGALLAVASCVMAGAQDRTNPGRPQVILPLHVQGVGVGAPSRPVENRAIVIVDRGGCDANTENDNLQKAIKEWCI
jgi:hypothetical protein